MFRSVIPSTQANVIWFDEPYTSFQRDVSRMLEDAFGGWAATGGRGAMPVVPSMEVRETDKSVEVAAELPGVDRKDLQVTYASGILTISGEKKAEMDESGNGCRLSERSYGAFSRSMCVDDVDADRIEATFANGVLKVTLPKAPSARAKARAIEIKSAR